MISLRNSFDCARSFSRPANSWAATHPDEARSIAVSVTSVRKAMARISTSLLLQSRRPVEDHAERRRGSLINRDDHQEPLAIGGHVVAAAGTLIPQCRQARGEQLPGFAH